MHATVHCLPAEFNPCNVTRPKLINSIAFETRTMKFFNLFLPEFAMQERLIKNPLKVDAVDSERSQNIEAYLVYFVVHCFTCLLVLSFVRDIRRVRYVN